MNLFDIILKSIDFIIVGLVLASGFFQKRYLSGFSLVKTDSLDSALKTLGLSFVVSVIYILILKDPDKPSNWAKYFISYFFATSLYELIVEPFANWVKLKFGNDK
jgi:hypothetical protein